MLLKIYCSKRSGCKLKTGNRVGNNFPKQRGEEQNREEGEIGGKSREEGEKEK